jgi:hypothetical protein
MRPPADTSGRIEAIFLQILSGLAPGVATLAALHHHDRATRAYQQ